jgi:cytoskeletal protein CcmA (bactofilin family)
MRRRNIDPEVLEGEIEMPDHLRDAGSRVADMTVIGKGARLEGTLMSAGSLRIEGSVKGRINAEGDVILADGSEVQADINASNVAIATHYVGNVTAAGTLELESSARLEGNITCQALVVNRGAVFSGQSSMNGEGILPVAEKIEEPLVKPVERPVAVMEGEKKSRK